MSKKMNKEIEEMANIIYKRVNTLERFGLTGMELCKKIAEELLKYYQPNLSEDSVVLSMEEFEKLKLELAIEKKIACESYTQKEVEEIIASKERIKSKETAEKILNELICTPHEYHERKIKEFAKQFGVEIKE